MRTIKEVLHEKRKATEDHIKDLQRQGKQGVRYFRRSGFHHVLD